MKRGASISRCGRHRYWLRREWCNGRTSKSILFVMLNPSTADAAEDDPTIKRCVGFAHAWGFGVLEVVNLFALRATEPRELEAPGVDRIGPDNDAVLQQTFARFSFRPVVCGWGSHPVGWRTGRDADVLQMMHRAGCRPRALEINRAGTPKHPLYIGAAQTTVEYLGREFHT